MREDGIPNWFEAGGPKASCPAGYLLLARLVALETVSSGGIRVDLRQRSDVSVTSPEASPDGTTAAWDVTPTLSQLPSFATDV